MKELEKSELMKVDGGAFGFDDLLGLLASAIIVSVATDWEGFKKGFASAF